MSRDFSDLECVWNLKQLCFVGQHEVSPLIILTLKPILKYKNTHKQYDSARHTKPLQNTAKNSYN